MSADLDKAIAAKGRHISLMIAGTMLAWMALTMIIGPAVGMPGRYALLFDFAALAAMIYAGINILQLWRMRQASKK